MINLEEAMRTYGNDVLRLAYVYVGSEASAQDIFQEVFLKVYKHQESFLEKSSMKTWIYKITINTCKDYLKSAWVRRAQNQLSESTAAEESLEDAAARNDEARRVTKKVLALPAAYKDVILLYYYKELDTREIAQVLQIAQGTVRSRLHRGRLLLQKALESEVTAI